MSEDSKARTGCRMLYELRGRAAEFGCGGAEAAGAAFGDIARGFIIGPASRPSSRANARAAMTCHEDLSEDPGLQEHTVAISAQHSDRQALAALVCQGPCCICGLQGQMYPAGCMSQSNMLPTRGSFALCRSAIVVAWFH